MSSSLKVIQYFSSRVQYYIFNNCHLLDDKGINLLKVIIILYFKKHTKTKLEKFNFVKCSVCSNVTYLLFLSDIS